MSINLTQLEKDKAYTLSPSQVSKLRFPKGQYNLTIIYKGGEGEREIPMGPMDENSLELELESLRFRPNLIEYQISLVNS